MNSHAILLGMDDHSGELRFFFLKEDHVAPVLIILSVLLLLLFDCLLLACLLCFLVLTFGIFNSSSILHTK